MSASQQAPKQAIPDHAWWTKTLRKVYALSKEAGETSTVRTVERIARRRGIDLRPGPEGAA